MAALLQITGKTADSTGQRGAAARGSAAFWRIGLLGLVLLTACAGPPLEGEGESEDSRRVAAEHIAVWAAASPKSCAWFGSRAGDLLWFGVSGYWARSRDATPATALEATEPPRIGRFHLGREEMLAPLELAAGPARGGVWDVLALADGRVLYTGLAERAGWVDPRSGISAALGVGAGANELCAISKKDATPGEDGDGGDERVAVTDYFGGAIAVARLGGEPPRRIPLPAHDGLRVAPKSVAFDPHRNWLWITTDLFAAGGAAAGHDARAVDLASGAQTLRIADPELQTLGFDESGTGFLVWSTANGLVLQVLGAGDPPRADAGRHIPLAADFDRSHDYAQDLAIEAGRVVVATWSGRVFVVDPTRGAVRVVSLPRSPPGSLYYSAALVGDRVCATRCGGVAVVCSDLP